MIELLKENFSVKGTKLKFLVVIIITTIFSLVEARITLLISNIISNAELGNISLAYEYLKIFILLNVLSCILQFTKFIVKRDVRNKVFTELLSRFAEKIINSDYNLFAKYSDGFIQTALNNIGGASNGGIFAIDSILSIIQLGILIGSVYLIEPNLIIPILIVYVLGFVAILKTWKIVIKLDTKVDETARSRNDEINKIIRGFAEVRSNNTQHNHLNAIKELNNSTLFYSTKKARMNSAAIVLFHMVDSFCTIIAIMFAILSIQNGSMMSATAMVIIMYVGRLMGPLDSMIGTACDASEYVTGYKKYKEIMNYKDTAIDGDIELDSFNSSIKINNVSFAYESSDTVLQNINLEIKKGERVGICGHSGGGKSTLLKLLNRFYDVSEGSIEIDGIDIRNLTQNSLRSKIGMVHQSNYIFKGTIRDNVTYGIGDVPELEVVEACKKAGIYDFIKTLKDGLNTDVGPNGLKLSGGQQQRIAIARLFLRDPDIILLDEATSALDNEAEAIIQDSLKLFKDKTIITIAHRLSTIQDSDKIVVMNEHKIAEVGSHEELLQRKGLYYNLCNAKNKQ